MCTTIARLLFRNNPWYRFEHLALLSEYGALLVFSIQYGALPDCTTFNKVQRPR